ncbi:MAG: nucleoside deaminase, partial [Armatimonadetes bacterium]|nr:nucleoside deaminase [Armatimonadota bacterium]
RIYYGTNIADVAALGFYEMELSNFQMRDLGKSPIEIVPDFLRDECLELLRFWESLAHRRTY